MTLEVSSQPRWIIEGVFGWLAEVALPKATALRGLLNEGLWRGRIYPQARIGNHEERLGIEGIATR